MASEMNPAVARPEHSNDHQYPVGTAGFNCSSLGLGIFLIFSTESEGLIRDLLLLTPEAYFGNGGR